MVVLINSRRRKSNILLNGTDFPKHKLSRRGFDTENMGGDNRTRFLKTDGVLSTVQAKLVMDTVNSVKWG